MPATEDEVMAVEDLLDDDKINIRSSDSGQTLECSKNHESTLSSPNIIQLRGSEGLDCLVPIFLSFLIILFIVI